MCLCVCQSSEALRKSEAELGGYREREDESRRVAQQAIAEKENAMQASVVAEGEILKLRRELELEVQMNRRSDATLKCAESERTNVLRIMDEYAKIDAVRW